VLTIWAMESKKGQEVADATYEIHSNTSVFGDWTTEQCSFSTGLSLL
jgi:hypothetical protein